MPNGLWLLNGESYDILPGQPVVIDSADTAKYAIATTLPYVVGLSTETIATGDGGAIQTDGKLTLSTVEWDTVTGDLDGLVAGTTYYLSDVDTGKLLSSPPTTEGNYVVRIGLAVNATDLQLNISRPIKL